MSTRYNNGSHYENHQRAAELQNAPGHAHRSAEQQHDKQEHLTPHEETRHAMEHSRDSPNDFSGGDVPATVGHGVAAFGHRDIAARAYQLWQARGCPEGSPELDWFQAVKELRSNAAGNHSGAPFIG